MADYCFDLALQEEIDAGIEPQRVPVCSCGRKAKLVTGRKLYPGRRDLWKKKFWLCEPCWAYTGTHKNSPDHAPLGTLANAELRRWRKEVHDNFDCLWQKQNGKAFMRRSEAYSWLARRLGIGKKNCHIGQFDLDQCKAAIREVKQWFSTKQNQNRTG